MEMNMSSFTELDDNQAMEIDGGSAPAWLPGALGGLGTAWVCYELGNAVGKFAYYVTHR